MKIFVDVGEAAERLEELIDLVFRQDEVFFCRGERPIAQLTALSQRNHLRSIEPAEALADTEPATDNGNPIEQGIFHSIDEVWRLATEGRRTVPDEATSTHDALYDTDGSPK